MRGLSAFGLAYDVGIVALTVALSLLLGFRIDQCGCFASLDNAFILIHQSTLLIPGKWPRSDRRCLGGAQLRTRSRATYASNYHNQKSPKLSLTLNHVRPSRGPYRMLPNQHKPPSRPQGI